MWTKKSVLQTGSYVHLTCSEIYKVKPNTCTLQDWLLCTMNVTVLFRVDSNSESTYWEFRFSGMWCASLDKWLLMSGTCWCYLYFQGWTVFLDEIVKMSGFTHPGTQCHIPEDLIPQQLSSENFNCHSPYTDCNITVWWWWITLCFLPKEWVCSITSIYNL